MFIESECWGQHFELAEWSKRGPLFRGIARLCTETLFGGAQWAVLPSGRWLFEGKRVAFFPFNIFFHISINAVHVVLLILKLKGLHYLFANERKGEGVPLHWPSWKMLMLYTIENQNSFTICEMLRYHGYAAKTVRQWPLIFSRRNHSNETCYIWQTNWIWIASTRRTFWDYCQQNWSISTYLAPCKAKKLTFDFSFNNYKTVHSR